MNAILHTPQKEKCLGSAVNRM